MTKHSLVWMKTDGASPSVCIETAECGATECFEWQRFMWLQNQTDEITGENTVKWAVGHKELKKNNYPQAGNWENTLAEVSMYLLLLLLWDTCMCQAVLGLLGVWSEPAQFQQMSCGGRRGGRNTGECQLWVQVDGCLEKLVLVFLVHMCFTASAWRQSHLGQAEACLAQCEVPHIPSDMQEVSGKRGHQEKSGPNAKRFADYTRVEIQRSTIITSILSPNLILCKVILGLGIA